MDIILHTLGTCGDNHSHIDLLDVLVGGTASGGIIGTITYYWNGIKFIIKNKFKRNN